MTIQLVDAIIELQKDIEPQDTMSSAEYEDPQRDELWVWQNEFIKTIAVEVSLQMYNKNKNEIKILVTQAFNL